MTMFDKSVMFKVNLELDKKMIEEASKQEISKSALFRKVMTNYLNWLDKKRRIKND